MNILIFGLPGSGKSTFWINTIKEGRFKDTNKIFQKPTKVDYEIKNYNYEKIIKQIHEKL